MRLLALAAIFLTPAIAFACEWTNHYEPAPASWFLACSVAIAAFAALPYIALGRHREGSLAPEAIIAASIVAAAGCASIWSNGDWTDLVGYISLPFLAVPWSAMRWTLKSKVMLTSLFLMTLVFMYVSALAIQGQFVGRHFGSDQAISEDVVF